MAETASIEVKRHYHDLLPQEIDELVGIVADLIVDFLKKRGDSGQSEDEVPA